MIKKLPTKASVLLLLMLSATTLQAQHTCPTIASRNNSNGQPNSCPGVSGTPIASNVTVAFSSVPAGNKTADVIWKHISADPWYTNPPVIVAVYTTTSGVSTSIKSYPGPPGAASSGNVKYCFYDGSSGNGNLPNAGIVSFRFATPTNVADYKVCTYDFTNSDALIANPASVPTAPLPIHFSNFTAGRAGTAVNLYWSVSGNSDVARYSIERSEDGTTFSEVYAMTPEQTTDYTYTDNEQGSALLSKVYYRIREVDNDGRDTYTGICTVPAVAGQGVTMGYTGSGIVIRCAAETQGVLQYIDLRGNVIGQENVTFASGLNHAGTDFGSMASVAIVRLISGGEVYVCKCSDRF